MKILIVSGFLVIALSGLMLFRVVSGKPALPIAEVIYPVTEWEHGFKTSRVIATREKNDTMGQFVKFDFPEDPDDCDAADLSDFIESQGGSIFEGGGESGAAMYVRFKGVDTKEQASAKIKEVLPGLSKVMFAVANGLPTGVQKRPEYKWPDASPIDKSDPCWQLNNNIVTGGNFMSPSYRLGEQAPEGWYKEATNPYHKAEVSPGKWEWLAGEEPAKKDADPRCEWAGGWSDSGGNAGTEYAIRKAPAPAAI